VGHSSKETIHSFIVPKEYTILILNMNIQQQQQQIVSSNLISTPSDLYYLWCER
jgi:hypothetical protein